MTRRPEMSAKAVVGVAIFTLLLVLFVCGPVLSGVDPDAQVLSQRNRPPSIHSPFGTDELGRDLFVRICNGGRHSLLTALVAGFVALVIGSCVGGLAGLSRGSDRFVIQGVDLLVSVSNLPVILVLTPWFARFPGGLGLLFGLVTWDRIARVVRGETKSLLASSVLIAAVVSGATKPTLLTRYVWPRLAGLLSAEVLLIMALSSSLEATLGFLEFGSSRSLGVFLSDARGMATTQTSRLAIPATLLVLIVISLYLMRRETLRGPAKRLAENAVVSSARL